MFKQNKRCNTHSFTARGPVRKVLYGWDLFFLPRLVMLTAVLLFFAVCGAHAQEITGALFGSVSDSAGAIVPGAHVSILNQDTRIQRELNANEKAEYTFSDLPIGTYTVTVSAPSFETFVQKNVTIDAAQSAHVDAKLSPGSVDTTVTVENTGAALDMRSATLGTLIDPATVEQTPIDGNNVVSLAALLPGVTSITAPAAFTNERQGPVFSASGSRVGQNLFLFDGIIYNNFFRNTGANFPPRETIQEIQVLTNNYGAEYGHNAGAIFSAVSKSGSNSVHGAIWEYAENTYLNAANYLSGKIGNKLIQNQYGGSIGGPIVKYKLFFFLGYQGFRKAASSSGTVNAFTSSRFVPASGSIKAGAPEYTNATTDAIFPSTIVDPKNGKSFPLANGVAGTADVPFSRFDPTAVALIQTFGLYTPNSTGQYTSGYPAPLRSEFGSARIDYTRGRHQIDARYFALDANSTAISGNLFTYDPQTNDSTSFLTEVEDTFIATPNLLNVARAGYRRFKTVVIPGDSRSLSSFGANLPSFGPPTLPNIVITGGPTLSNSSNTNQIGVNENVEINDSVSWTRGTHSYKFGGTYLRLQYLNRTYANTQGDFTFAGTYSKSGLADFLLGLPSQLIIASPVLEQSGIQHQFFFYAQDQWRARQNLTISYGLRYELPFNWFQPQNHWGTFRQGVQSKVIPTAPTGLLFVGDSGIDRGIVTLNWHDLAPRLGFSYDPRSNGKTVIRGGFGVAYDAINADIIQNTGQPYQYKFTYSNVYSFSDPLRNQPPIPTTANLANPQFVGTPTLNFPDPNLRSPYVLQYNLGFQKSLPAGILAEADYVGRVSRKLFEPISFNPAIGGTTCGTATQCQASLDARRIIPGFGDLEEITTEGSGNYNALQARFTRRRRNVTVNGSYTYSRALDTGSVYDSESGYVPSPFNLGANYGPSDFNATHVLTLGYVVNLPSLTRQPWFLREAAGGWVFSGIYSWRTGSPLNITLGSDAAYSGTPNQRPVYVHNPNLPQNRDKRAEIAMFLDPTAFAAPAPGTYGNVSRNSVTGPGQITNNVALGKNFAIPRLGEATRFELRIDAFGVFNTPNLRAPSGSNIQLGGGANFGKLTNTTGERVIQLAGHLWF